MRLTIAIQLAIKIYATLKKISNYIKNLFIDFYDQQTILESPISHQLFQLKFSNLLLYISIVPLIFV